MWEKREKYLKENQKFRLRFFSLCEMSDFSFFSQKKNSPDKSLFYSFTHEKNKFSWKFFLLFGFTGERIKSEIVFTWVNKLYQNSQRHKHEDKFSWLCFFPPRNIKISFHQFSWSRERKLFLSDRNSSWLVPQGFRT